MVLIIDKWGRIDLNGLVELSGEVARGCESDYANKCKWEERVKNKKWDKDSMN